MGRFNNLEEDRWISVSDIMTGLMVIFLFIAVAYILESQRKEKVIQTVADELGISDDSVYTVISRLMEVSTNLRKRQDTISSILGTYRNNRHQIYREMIETFGKDLDKWGAAIDSTTLSVRFNGDKTKFEPARDVVPDGFKSVLDDFIPKYLKVVTNSRYFEDILEVRIEGHAFDSGEPFLNLLRVSQKRAGNVLLYFRDHPEFKKLPRHIRKELEFKMTTTGMGGGRMIDGNGNFIQKSGTTPCSTCSRRVEFTLLTASERVIELLETQVQ